MPSQEDIELLQDYRTESLEHFNEIEPLFLEVEEAEGEAQSEIINGIFRAVHSVKGAAGFFGLNLIQDLSHAMENLMMRVRDGKLPYSAEVTDGLLTALDTLRPMIDALPGILESSIAEDVAALTALIEAGDGSSDSSERATSRGDESAEEAAEPAAEVTQPDAVASERAPLEPDQDGLLEAKHFGRALFEVSLSSEIASNVDEMDRVRNGAASIGSILVEDLTPACPRILVATVLAADMLASELEISAEHVVEYRSAATEEKPEESSKLPPEAAPNTSVAPVPSEEGAKETASAVVAPKAEPPARGTSGPAKEADSTIRVQVGVLDKLMNLAGELVLVRNQLMSSLGDTNDPAIKAILQSMSLVTSELQTNIMSTRMQAVGGVFKRFHRVVRDMSRKLGKKVELELEGSEVELDKSIIEMLSDPLTHLVRNSLDHGIGTPEERKAAGKNPMATLALRAYHEGGQVNIEIYDDGRGIDAEKMRGIAVQKGVIGREEAEVLSDQDAVRLIFAAGFSTAETVTDVSGRGVGMDVVKSNISKLGGKIDIETEIGKGTTIRVRLPLTLAIIPSLIVAVGGERFAVPQVNLVELVRVKAGDTTNRIENVRGAAVLRLRGNLLPLVRLDRVLGIEREYEDPQTGEIKKDRRERIADRREFESEPDRNEALRRDENNPQQRASLHDRTLHVLVLRVDENRYGLIVDRVQDSEEIVVKPLSDALKGCRSFAGATIMGDGRVAMIIDVNGIAAGQNLDFSEVASEVARRTEEELGSQSDSRELILFTNAKDEQFAVDLEHIVRLERIEPSQIETIGDQEFIQYRGGALPLVRLERQIAVGALETIGDELFVLIPKSGEANAGILVSQVIDTVETSVSLDRAAGDPDAIAGRAIVDGRLTVFLNTDQLVGGQGAIQ